MLKNSLIAIVMVANLLCLCGCGQESPQAGTNAPESDQTTEVTTEATTVTNTEETPSEEPAEVKKETETKKVTTSKRKKK